MFPFSIQNSGKFSSSISNSPVLPGHNTSGHPIGRSGRQEPRGRNNAYRNTQRLPDTGGILNTAAQMVLPVQRQQPRKTRSAVPNIRGAIHTSIRPVLRVRVVIHASSQAHLVPARATDRLHSKSLL